MRAVVVTEFGAPEVLAIQERAAPALIEGSVLVRVHATAVNRADILQRLGMYPAPPDAVQDVLGLEFAGVVEAVFSADDQHWLGKRVCGIASGGTYAELVAVDSGVLMHIPEGMSFVEAAAIPEAFITAHDALCSIAHTERSYSVLINGAASGVGVAAIQIAKAIGAEVFASVRTASKADILRSYGANVLSNHLEFSDELRTHVARGADVLLDLVGASAAEENLRALAYRGCWVLVGLLGGSRCELDLATLLRKRARIEGTVLRGRTALEKRAATEQFVEFSRLLWKSKSLFPVIYEVFSLEDVKRAHQVMQGNQNVGKIVLSIVK